MALKKKAIAKKRALAKARKALKAARLKLRRETVPVRKKKKRKYVRKAKPEVAEMFGTGLPVAVAVAADRPSQELTQAYKQNNLEAAMENVPPRMLMLNKAAKITGMDRNSLLGDPIFTFEGIAALKMAFWDSVHPVAGNVEHENGSDPRVQNSATGHAIDMILMKLGRIATAPSNTIQEDTLLDLAAYTAILYEAAKRKGQLGSTL